MAHSLHWWTCYFRVPRVVLVGIIKRAMRSLTPQAHTSVRKMRIPVSIPACYLIFPSSYLMLHLTISLVHVLTRESEEQRHAYCLLTLLSLGGISSKRRKLCCPAWHKAHCPAFEQQHAGLLTLLSLGGSSSKRLKLCCAAWHKSRELQKGGARTARSPRRSTRVTNRSYANFHSFQSNLRTISLSASQLHFKSVYQCPATVCFFAVSYVSLTLPASVRFPSKIYLPHPK